MVGISAGRATFDPGHPPGGFTESVSSLQDHRAGGIALALLATGMACFASWLAISAIYRRDHAGPAHSVLVAGRLGDAAIYFGFMVSLLGTIFGSKGSNEYLSQSWVGWLVTGVGGKIVVGFAAAIVFACGGLVAWGLAGDIEGPLKLPPTGKRVMRTISRYGTAGRGLMLPCHLGDPERPRRAHELGGILSELHALPAGVVITAAFALAFIGSSALDFVVAVFRRFGP